MPNYVISSIGKDKPGIVGAFTEVLFKTGCNIEDASMTILCNQFAMILIISTPDDFNIGEMKQALKSVETKFNLFTSIKHIAENDINGLNSDSYKPHIISVSGSDKTGIAYHITNILAEHKVNITDFNSKLISKKANPVYIMMIETRIPAETDMLKLTQKLKNKAEEINVDLTIKEIELCEL